MALTTEVTVEGMSNGHSSTKALAMAGGEGEHSYAKNSQSQAQVLGTCQSAIFEALQSLDNLPLLTAAAAYPALRIADLGCATGKNSATAVKNLLDLLKHKYEESATEMPEVEVLFSDLITNDFNSLFRELPATKLEDLTLKHHGGDERAYFAGAVPGSFFGRLFPSRSMHIIMSSGALHWLSQVPPQVLDKNSPAYNQGFIHLDSAKPAVQEAVAARAASDLNTFLRHRAAELVPGGLLILIFAGRVDPDPTTGEPGAPGLLENGIYVLRSFEKIVSEEIVDVEKLDTFNIPMYSRNLEEVDSAIRQSNCYNIHLLKTFARVPVLAKQEKDKLLEDPKLLAKTFANKMRAVNMPLCVSHLGEECFEIMMDRLEKIAESNHVDIVNKMTLNANVAVLVRR